MTAIKLTTQHRYGGTRDAAPKRRLGRGERKAATMPRENKVRRDDDAATT